MNGEDFYNRVEATKSGLFPTLARNAALNYSAICDGTKVSDISKWYSPDPLGPAIVFGSGASLVHAVEGGLKKVIDQHSITTFAGPSHFHYLKENSIGVDFMPVTDPRALMKQYFTQGMITDEVLLAHPGIDPRIVDEYKTVVMALQFTHDPGWGVDDQGLTVGEFLKKYQILADSPVKKYFKSPYSVLMHPVYEALFSDLGIKTRIVASPNMTLWGVALATYMGYGPIFLCGYDLGYIDCTLDRVPYPPHLPKVDRAKMGMRDVSTGIYTDNMMLSYKIATAMMCLVKSVEGRDYNMAELYTSCPGNVECLPQWSLGQLKNRDSLSLEMADTDRGHAADVLSIQGIEVQTV